MNIVLMKEKEKKIVKSIAYKAFQPFFRLLISLQGRTWLAKEGSEIIGGVVVKTFETRGIKNGFVAFLFTHPNHKKKGIGHMLTKKAMEDLRELGCTRIFTTIEGNNTSSERVFYSENLRPINFLEQIKLFSFDLIKILFHTGHYFDIGYRLWTSEKLEDKKSNSLSNLAITILLNTLVMVFILFRGKRGINPTFFSFYLISFSIILGTRFITDFITNKLFNIKGSYRLWDSGFILNFIIALLFGAYCPNTGAFYPNKEDWNYRDYKNSLGKMAVISIITQFILYISIFYSNLAFRGYLLFISTATLIVDLLPFAPFDVYNGRRLWKYNKFLWFILALPILIIIFYL